MKGIAKVLKAVAELFEELPSEESFVDQYRFQPQQYRSPPRRQPFYPSPRRKQYLSPPRRQPIPQAHGREMFVTIPKFSGTRYGYPISPIRSATIQSVSSSPARSLYRASPPGKNQRSGELSVESPNKSKNASNGKASSHARNRQKDRGELFHKSPYQRPTKQRQGGNGPHGGQRLKRKWCNKCKNRSHNFVDCRFNPYRK